ncbi:hypothetical protein [Gloeobacter morelensis]|uniref:Uncharacterized protein n=1 Tax=Gloeobacter morelensis MG652769 TaxID=2781736 RepID=A0ABY3PHR1_9CYAN|nr:hypothetical protein [Gloeobacter morelensis]UFP93206.1 hypothetical protein ISF26_15500 [Gloeobacter morelensis MG652769]
MIVEVVPLGGTVAGLGAGVVEGWGLNVEPDGEPGEIGLIGAGRPTAPGETVPLGLL